MPLKPDTWEALSAYLDEALTLTAAERSQWLAAFEEKNPELAAPMRTLLQEHEALKREGFLSRSPGVSAIETSLAGQTIGAYTLLSPIGAGGMGSVWLAERNDRRFERRAAVKFLNIALAEREQERFRREGSILGRLNHPHIAQLLDAGVSASGQPYLILEYVDGEAIDQYCEHRKLELEARIRIFIDVLAAVAHAHANLVVHRDIKPSNVLVASHGQVKLLDFGIAKLLEEEGASAGVTQLTREIGAALTPYYAAPEQVTGRPVTTGTDVYSLGLLLYLLLTGRHPAGRDPHSPAELMKMITEVDPPLASDAVVSASETANPGFANCGTTPDRLRRLLRGDLDTIIAKALKKNPGERYVTASALADDLQRYLRHEPISARRDTLAYRTAKFVRRYRIPVAAVAVTIIALSVGLAVAARERNLAAQRYLAVRAIAAELFNVDRDIRALSGATAARERIVRTSLHYLEDLSKGAGNDLALKAEIATGYRQVAEVQGVFGMTNLGHPEDARASLVKAEALFREISRARPRDSQPLRDLIETVDLQSRIDHAALNFTRLDGRLSELESLLTAYESRAPQGESTWTLLANVYDSIAVGNTQMSKLEQAASFERRSTEYRRRLAAQLKSIQARGNLSNSLSGYGTICRKAGMPDEAVAAYQEAIALIEGILVEQPNHYRARINLANTLSNLGRAYGDMDGPSLGRRDEAIANLERSVQIGRAAIASDPNEIMVRFNHSVANLILGDLMREANPRRALEAYDEAIDVVTPVQNNLAKVSLALALVRSSFPLRDMHRDDEARRRLREATQLAEVLRKAGSPGAVECDEALSRAKADWSMADGRPMEAIELHRGFLAEAASAPQGALDTNQSLGDAFKMARRYRLLAEALTAAGQDAEAAQAQARRQAIIGYWKKKLPGNPSIELLEKH